MDSITIYKKPDVYNPLLVIGFSGWANAGEVSSETVTFLIESLRAVKFAEIHPEEFYNLTQHRPWAVIEKGLVKDLKYPFSEFYYVKGEGNSIDLVIFKAEEPHLKWKNYIDCIMNLASSLGVKRIMTIGGVVDHVPHTIEPLLTALANDGSLRDFLKSRDIQMIDYIGPSSIHGPLLERAGRQGIRYMSLWGRAPYYVQTLNYKILLKILNIFREITEIRLDLSGLKEKGEFFNQKIDLAIKNKPEFQDYIKKLEKQYLSERQDNGPAEKNERSKVIEIKAFVKKGPEPKPEEET